MQGGCVHPTSVGQWRASINVPDGSILTYVYFGFWNYIDSTATHAYLYRYFYSGTADLLLDLTSYAGSSGTGALYVGSTISPNVAVDNLNYAYMFVWNGANPASVQELCYIQVGYIPPSIFGAALPMIVR